MSNIYVIHGDESQLIEDKKKSLMNQFSHLRVETFTVESGAMRINEALREDSLFGDGKLIVLSDVPVLKTTERRGNKERLGNDTDWDNLYTALSSYVGDNPVIMVYHSNLDKRVKNNKNFLAQVDEFHFHKLSKDELIRWSESYCRNQGITFSADGKRYFFSLMELWEEVPLAFLKTEFDRLLLFLPKDGAITAKLLAQEGSDFGSKNIFKFTDAFFQKDVKTLRDILPFILRSNEVDRFFAYLEGQLRLQIMVSECRKAGVSESATFKYLTELGMTVKSYPVKLAYERSKRVSHKELQTFLQGMYQLVLNSRRGNDRVDAFRELCYAYCLPKEA